MILPDGLLCLDHPRPAGWTHLTLNYIGSENEQATIMYYDSEKVASTTTKYSGTNPPGDSRIVVGRRHADADQNYISAQVDELIFFNKTLSSTDIKLCTTEFNVWGIPNYFDKISHLNLKNVKKVDLLSN